MKRLITQSGTSIPRSYTYALFLNPSSPSHAPLGTETEDLIQIQTLCHFHHKFGDDPKFPQPWALPCPGQTQPGVQHKKIAPTASSQVPICQSHSMAGSPGPGVECLGLRLNQTKESLTFRSWPDCLYFCTAEFYQRVLVLPCPCEEEEDLRARFRGACDLCE